jgi:hypothetical protein
VNEIHNNEEKIEMIAQLTAGNKVKFQYVERKQDFNFYPANTSYEVEAYEGVVLESRNLDERPLDRQTVVRKPQIERSKFLLTVQLPDNKIKSFYDGRIINLQEVKEVPKSFVKRALDKLRGK